MQDRSSGAGGAQASQAKRDILLVDDDPGMIQMVGRILSPVAHVRFATRGEAALRQLRDAPADLVLLDAEMPGMSGFDLCAQLKDDPDLHEIPVIFLTSHTDAEFELRGLEIGAVDFITKPVREPLLLARVRTHLRLKLLADELRRMAAVDGLTGLCNRRIFDATLQTEWKRGLRQGSPMCALMIDVDHFKRYNDCYGHPTGDQCLRQIAGVLGDGARRPADLVARYGGEEFVLLLPQTPLEGARHVARRVLEAVTALAIPHAASPTAGHVSVSIGIGGFVGTPPTDLAGAARSQMQDAAALIEAADQALYAAKRAGRAQAWLAEVSLQGPVSAPRAIDAGAVAGDLIEAVS